MQMVDFWTSVIIWKTTSCITHNCLYRIYAYKLTSLSKCKNFLLIGVSVYDVYGSVILCCAVIRNTGWFIVPQFNLHSQTQWHSCDCSYLVSPGLVKQMLGQYLKPLSATYRISRPIRHTFFPEKCDLNSTCVLCAKGKYYFQTYKYPYIYYTTSLA